MKQIQPPGYVPGITYKKLHQIIRQLDSCQYQCEAGPLALNTFYIELKRLGQYVEQEQGERDDRADQSA